MKSFLLLTRGALVAIALFSSAGFCTLRADDPSLFGDGIYNKFGLDLGYAGRTHRWAVYTYGAGTSSSPFTALDVSGSGLVDGDVALAGAYSRLSVAGSGLVTGDRYEQTTSSETRSGSGVIGGTRFSSTSINSSLNGGITSLRNVSTSAAGLTPTSGSPTTLNLGGNTSRTFDNTPFGGKYVMRLTDFVLSGNSTLTLNGKAGSAFVLNISTNFNVSGSARILLTGGLTASDVLFNVTGNNSNFSLGGNAIFNGTLLAYNSASGGTQRTLTIGGNASVTGQVIANKVIVNGNGKVKKPKKVSKDDDDDDDDDDGDHGDGDGHGHKK